MNELTFEQKLEILKLAAETQKRPGYDGYADSVSVIEAYEAFVKSIIVPAIPAAPARL